MSNLANKIKEANEKSKKMMLFAILAILFILVGWWVVRDVSLAIKKANNNKAANKELKEEKEKIRNVYKEMSNQNKKAKEDMDKIIEKPTSTKIISTTTTSTKETEE